MVVAHHGTSLKGRRDGTINPKYENIAFATASTRQNKNMHTAGRTGVECPPFFSPQINRMPWNRKGREEPRRRIPGRR